MMRSCHALAAVVLLAGTGLAEGAPDYPPVVKDLPDGYDLNGAPVLDTGGFRLGEAREDVRKHLMEMLPPGSPETAIETQTMETGISDSARNSVSMLYDKTDTIKTEPEPGVREEITVYYTTNVSGTRAFGIVRTVRLNDDKQASTPDLIAALTEKYGEPSLATLGASNNDYWLFAAGQKASLTEAQYRSTESMKSGTAGHCVDRTSSMETYAYQDRREAAEACEVAVHVTMWPGKRPDLLQAYEVRLVAFKRQFDNFTATDHYLEQVLDAKVGSIGAGSKPRL